VRAPAYLALLGEVYTHLGRFEAAHKALDDGLAVVEKNDDRCHEAELYRLKGELLLAESPDGFAAAEDSFRRAIATAQRQKSKGWELRAATSLVRLLQRQERLDEARAVLSSVYDTFTEGHTTPDLMEAEAVLKTLR
jgi:adenylate cyclase